MPGCPISEPSEPIFSLKKACVGQTPRGSGTASCVTVGKGGRRPPLETTVHRPDPPRLPHCDPQQKSKSRSQTLLTMNPPGPSCVLTDMGWRAKISPAGNWPECGKAWREPLEGLLCPFVNVRLSSTLKCGALGISAQTHLRNCGHLTTLDICLKILKPHFC